MKFKKILAGLALLSSLTMLANDELITACKQGDLDAVKAAVSKGADVNYQDANGSTAISSSFLWPEITRYLIENGADVNGGSYPAIVSAATNYSVEVMQLLFEAGADPNKVAKVDPGAALRGMIEKEKEKGKKANKDMIKAWEGALATLKPTEITALETNIQQTNCVPCLSLLLENGASIDVVKDGNILHRLAAFAMTPNQRKEAFATGAPLMANYGFKVPDWYSNLADEYNGTSQEMAKLLIDKGANVNEVDKYGFSPLMTALGVQKADVAKGLILGGADVNFEPEDNRKDAVAMASEIGDLELLQMIAERGADLNRETWDLDKQTNTFCKGFTPLTRAAINNNYECAKYLIENGAKIKEGISGIYAKKAIHKNGKTQIVSLTGAELYCRYKLKNKTAIYFAIENGNMEMVKLLGESFGWYSNHKMEIKYIDPEKGDATLLEGVCLSNSGKFSPSMYAKEMGQDEIRKYLISKGK